MLRVGEPDGEHVDRAFHDDRRPAGVDAVALLAESVKGLSFVVDDGVGGVEVLGRVGGPVGCPAGESDRVAVRVVDGEYDPVTEDVDQAAGAGADGESCGDQLTGGVVEAG
jgi:hypothetical protein